jgi:hypothetical protein
MKTYCTCFDSNYLFKGLALYHSLVRHAPDTTLWVLCLDRATERTLERLALPGMRILPIEALEAAEPRLRGARQDRTKIEYYFTVTPAFVWHLLTRDPGDGPVTYLDADLYFFASPRLLLEESLTGSVSILGHRFPPRLQHLEKYGIYNVSWLTFRNDPAARECLAWWRNRCIEWCHDRLEDGKFADQKYLDDWPTRFKDVHVIAHPGAGLAPWNVVAHTIRLGQDGLTVDGSPLVFYHFHAFKRVLTWLFDPGLARYGARLTPEVRGFLYLPYLTELRKMERTLRNEVPDFSGGWGSARGAGVRSFLSQALRRQLLVAP